MTVRLLVCVLLFSALGLAGCSAKTAEGGSVAIHEFQYEPASITIQKGQHVAFANHDNVEHSVTPDSSGFTGTDIEGGKDATIQFDQAGTFPYHCKYHQSMHGTIVVQ